MTDAQPTNLPDGDIVVTGATGFLGGALVRQLLALGVPPSRLRCPVRDPERAILAGLPAIALRRIDLARTGCEEDLAATVRGAGLVLHLAGTLKGANAADFMATNCSGTRRLVRAIARSAPDAHVVHVSSLAAAGPGCDGAQSAALPSAARPVSLYGVSKLRGEDAVATGARSWTILRPPVVYGLGDPATRLLVRQACAPVTAVPAEPRPLSILHVDDFVAAAIATARVRPFGAVLPLDGPERTDTHSLLRAIASAHGRRARLVPIPMAVAGAAAVVAEVCGRAIGKVGFFNRDKVREIRAAGWVADGSEAMRLLGWRAHTTLAQGLRTLVHGAPQPARPATGDHLGIGGATASNVGARA